MTDFFRLAPLAGVERCGRAVVLSLSYTVWLATASAQNIPATPIRPSLPPGVISGQQPLTPGQRDMTLEQHRFDREMQQDEIERALNQPPGADLTVPQEPDSAPETTGDGDTHRVTLSGVDLDFGVMRPFFNVDSIAEPYLNRPLDNKGVFALVRLLTARIYEAGYITSNIALADPAVVDGRLRLRVNWGRIKGWRVNGEALTGWRDRTTVGWALPNWKDAILNIRDIDQAIENLNNGFKRARIAIAPASEAGYSDLELTTERMSWMRVTLGRDNSGYGTPANGRDKYNLTMQAGDLLGINDTLTLFTGRRFYEDRARNGEESYDMAYRVPLGYTRIDLQTGYSNYKNLIRSGGFEYQSAGNSRNLSLRLTRTVYRDASSQFSLYGALRTRQNENYLADRRLEVSSKNYSDGTLGLQWSKMFGRHAIFTDLSWNRGLSINKGQYSAFDDFDAIDYAKRINGTASWQASFAPAGQLLTAQSQFGFQYSRQMLLNNYQLTMGDEYTVRGYNRRSLQSGDKGMYLSNTLSMPFQFSLFAGRNAVIAPFVGIDAGVLRVNVPGASSTRMAGWALGSRFNFPYFSIAATYSKPFWMPEGRAKTPVWYINTSISL